MAFAAARMIKDKAKRPSTDFALYPVSPILRQNITENWPCHEVEPKKRPLPSKQRVFPFAKSEIGWKWRIIAFWLQNAIWRKICFKWSFMLKELYCLQNFDLAKTFSLRVVDCFANMMMPKLQLCYQTFEMVEEPLFPSNEIIPCKDPFANFVSKLWMDEWMSPSRDRDPLLFLTFSYYVVRDYYSRSVEGLLSTIVDGGGRLSL